MKNFTWTCLKMAKTIYLKKIEIQYFIDYKSRLVLKTSIIWFDF